MSVDPQVALLRKVPDPQSLHDVLVGKYDFSRADPGNLFTARLLLCGKKQEGTHIGGICEEIAKTAGERANHANPFITSKNPGKPCNSVLVDYGSEFIQLIEGPERHVFSYVAGLRRPTNTHHGVHILFFEDDVQRCLPTGWLLIDKVPPASLGGAPQEKSDTEIGESVIHDFANLRELGVTAGETDRNRRSLFADNAKINHPKLFPRCSNVDMYIHSELFLTLEEFENAFCGFPSGSREAEVSHPMEDPLKY